MRNIAFRFLTAFPAALALAVLAVVPAGPVASAQAVAHGLATALSVLRLQRGRRWRWSGRMSCS